MRAKICLVITSLLLAVVSIHAQSIWDGKHLERVKQSLHQPYFSAAYQELISGADRLLDVRPLSVMLKEKTPGSGDKHDYMSQPRTGQAGSQPPRRNSSTCNYSCPCLVL